MYPDTRGVRILVHPMYRGTPVICEIVIYGVTDAGTTLRKRFLSGWMRRIKFVLSLCNMAVTSKPSLNASVVDSRRSVICPSFDFDTYQTRRSPDVMVAGSFLLDFSQILSRAHQWWILRHVTESCMYVWRLNSSWRRRDMSLSVCLSVSLYVSV